MDYTALSLYEVRTGIEATGHDVHATFGRLDSSQLNWRPGRDAWSVAQCLDHLLKANTNMFVAVDAALDESTPRTIWQRLPFWPRFAGRMLVKSQAPSATRKYKADPAAQPETSDVEADVVDRFVRQQREIATKLRAIDESRAERIVMVSPFVTAITYSVLDGCRLVLAHDHRHVEQARRVTQMDEFPR